MMTASDLRYLIAADRLFDGENGVKLTDIAAETDVTKVSVYRAVERMEKNGYVCRNEKNKIVLTEEGKRSLREYMVTVRFLSAHFEKHCGVPAEIAYQDAICAACALSDVSRKGIAAHIKENEA